MFNADMRRRNFSNLQENRHKKAGPKTGSSSLTALLPGQQPLVNTLMIGVVSVNLPDTFSPSS